MAKVKTAKSKKTKKNINQDVGSDVSMSGHDFVDMSDELGMDSDDLTSAYAKSKVTADDSWDIVSTDDDDGEHNYKGNISDGSDEDQLDAIIADYAGVDGLAPEKSNDDKK